MTLRTRILDLAREYAAGQSPKAFLPGETYIPVSGKILDEEDLVNLIDASMDMHLTA
jgi:CDP-6-deoxy-D-xylo-4-hexulose-3-dehydrase